LRCALKTGRRSKTHTLRMRIPVGTVGFRATLCWTI
jgi:hypothetical protein